MSYLGKATGYFSLASSNLNIGSLFKVEDVLEILEIKEQEVSNIRLHLNRLKILKEGYVDESLLYKHFKVLKNMFSQKSHINNVSWDEYVLMAIIRKEFPEMKVEQQPKVLGNKHADFLLEYDGKKVYLEFDGPGHFISNKELEDPFVRSKQIEDETGIEVVRWPYWIQRCKQNIKVIFDKKEDGFGSLWNSNAHFGDFTLQSAPSIIKKMTERFNAVRNDGVGYFYEGNMYGRTQPEHPIIKKILKGKEDYTKLIPPGANNKEFWLPSSLLKV